LIVAGIPGLESRFAAWRILHDVRHGVPFDTALARAIKDLEPDDKRLAHELAAGVFRHRSELDRALEPAVARGIGSVRPDTLDLLRLGAFQLRSLDRVPAHAAVQTTVAVARRLGGARVAGFVNAVLRKLARGAEAGGGDEPASLASEYSHPEWLVERWERQVGPAATRDRLAANNRRPPLVIQPNDISLAELEASLEGAGVTATRAPWDAGLVVESARATELPGFAEGRFYVQDPAQRMVARFLQPDPGGAVVYDACAAPGGKTLGIAPGAGFVVAADWSPRRTRRLAENLARAGRANVAPVVADAIRPPIRTADAVLLDVPCLGTGTLARNPDARWRVSPAALDTLVAQSARLLDAAAETVAPGGLLLFATCSLEPEENAEQIDRFLARDHRFRREPGDRVPAELLTPDGDVLILPEAHGTDGAYAARLRKVAP
jgi:16S rRNA (cytosine967-C5)-methyltransferase